MKFNIRLCVHRHVMCILVAALVILSLFVMMIGLRIQFNAGKKVSFHPARGENVALPSADEERLVAFVHVSDTHLQVHSKPERTRRIQQFLLNDLSKQIQPAWIIHSGDLTDAHPSLSESEQVLKDWTTYFSLLDERPGFYDPSFFVDQRGNHDVFDVQSWTDPTNYYRSLGVWGPVYEGSFVDGTPVARVRARVRLDLQSDADSGRSYAHQARAEFPVRRVVVPVTSNRSSATYPHSPTLPFDAEPRVGRFDVTVQYSANSSSLYSFVLVDSTPIRAQGSLFNFFGQRSDQLMVKAGGALLAAREDDARHLFLVDHYPLALLPRSLAERAHQVQVTARLCGHEHMEKLHFANQGDLLDLELADFKDHSRYAVFAIDHETIAFALNTAAQFPFAVCTNPKDARFISRNDPDPLHAFARPEIRCMLWFDDTEQPSEPPEVVLDGKSLCRLQQAHPAAASHFTRHLWTCPWPNRQQFERGLHSFRLTVADHTLADYQFSLDGTRDFLGVGAVRLGNSIQLAPAITALNVLISLLATAFFVVWPVVFRMVLLEGESPAERARNADELWAALLRHEDGVPNQIDLQENAGVGAGDEVDIARFREGRNLMRIWLIRTALKFSFLSAVDRVGFLVLFMGSITVLPLLAGKLTGWGWGALFLFGKVINGEYLGQGSAPEAGALYLFSQVFVLLPFTLLMGNLRAYSASHSADMARHDIKCSHAALNWRSGSLFALMALGQLAVVLIVWISGAFNLVIMSPLVWMGWFALGRVAWAAKGVRTRPSSRSRRTSAASSMRSAAKSATSHRQHRHHSRRSMLDESK